MYNNIDIKLFNNYYLEILSICKKIFKFYLKNMENIQQTTKK